MSCNKVSLEICPSLVRSSLLVLYAAGAHEIACDKDLGVTHVDLPRMANFHASYLIKARTILDLFEEGLHWMPRVPCLAHMLEIVF
jgi:hypothetical protein